MKLNLTFDQLCATESALVARVHELRRQKKNNPHYTSHYERELAHLHFILDKLQEELDKE